jgi:hypothetical protein
LNHLVKRKPEQELNEPWDSDILFAYNSTMSLIGGALQAITAGEPEPTVGLTQKRHQLTRFFQHNKFSTTTAIVELFLIEIQIQCMQKGFIKQNLNIIRNCFNI